jgi:hypothetical protein
MRLTVDCMVPPARSTRLPADTRRLAFPFWPGFIRPKNNAFKPGAQQSYRLAWPDFAPYLETLRTRTGPASTARFALQEVRDRAPGQARAAL